MKNDLAINDMIKKKYKKYSIFKLNEFILNEIEFNNVEINNRLIILYTFNLIKQ